LSAILPWIFSTLKPGVVFVLDDESLTWLSATSRAQMTEMSHQVELPIHFFCPLRDPGVAFALRSRQKSAGRSGTHQRLGQAKTADLVRNAPLAAATFCFCSSDPVA